MATHAGTEDHPIQVLRSLVKLDYDAIEDYEAAIERLDDPMFKAQLAEFCEDHRRHVADLNLVIQNLGGDPVLQGDFKRILTQGRILLGSMVGDKQVLSAMKSNEDDTNEAYARAMDRELPFSLFVTSILARSLADERRHLAYLVQALASFEKRGVARVSRTSRPEVRESTPSLL